jgi:hypothetical protein
MDRLYLESVYQRRHNAQMSWFDKLTMTFVILSLSKDAKGAENFYNVGNHLVA